MAAHETTKQFDLKATEKNFSVFLGAYKAVRLQNDLPMMPAYTKAMTIKKDSLIDLDSLETEKLKEITHHFQQKYLELDPLFRVAFKAITHKQAGKLNRSKRIFLKRYFGEFDLETIQTEEGCSKGLIKTECREAMYQFCECLGIAVRKE